MAKTSSLPDHPLLHLAYWSHAGLPAKTPDWVRAHPLFPANNDVRAQVVVGDKSHLTSPVPGRDRLWEAIEQEYGIDLRP